MLTSFCEEPAGATPLSPEDLLGLIPVWVSTRADLNLAEFQNINKVESNKKWQTLRTDKLLDDLQLRKLHRDMFSDVWKWAGQYRSHDLNIGVDFHKVAEAVRNLLDDAKLWFANEENIDLVACRLHHQLVFIHPFHNGNGRLARLFVNLVLASANARPFSWGSESLATATETRQKYIAALRAADRGNLEQLLQFARS